MINSIIKHNKFNVVWLLSKILIPQPMTYHVNQLKDKLLYFFFLKNLEVKKSLTQIYTTECIVKVKINAT